MAVGCARAEQNGRPHPVGAERAESGARPTFEAVYEAHFDFVWSSLRSLGVSTASLDDCAQEVFIVVHRRLGEFEGRSSIKTWLFRIVRGIASNYRRGVRRKGTVGPLREDIASKAPGPVETLSSAEALALVERALDRLDEDKRVAFVLSELEGLSTAEMSEMLGVNVNTLYARVRAARQEIDRLLAEESS